MCGNLGDALLLTPVIEGWRKQFPECRIYCYGRKPKALEILEPCPHLDGIVSSPREVLSTPPENFQKIINNFDSEELIFASLICRLKPALQKPRRHIIRLLGRLAGLTLDPDRLRVYLTPQDEEFGQNIAGKLNRPVAALHTTSFSCRNKEWYVERWSEVIKELTGWGYEVVQIGAEGETLAPGATDLLGLPIRKALAVVKYAKLFLGIDAVFSHAAAAFQIPGVVLFGATTPEVWGHSGHINLYRGLPCQPCMDIILGSCHIRRCMQQIQTEEVLAALKRLVR